MRKAASKSTCCSDEDLRKEVESELLCEQKGLEGWKNKQSEYDEGKQQQTRAEKVGGK